MPCRPGRLIRHGSGVSLTDVHVAEAEVLEFLELPREQAAELLSAWLIIEPSAWLIAKEQEPSYTIIRLLFGFKYFFIIIWFYSLPSSPHKNLYWNPLLHMHSCPV